MGGLTPSVLPVALRAWIARTAERKKGPYQPPVLPWPESALILDVETTTDATQRLLFGSYRVGNFGDHGEFECLEEGLIYADDLPDTILPGWAVLQEYASTQATGHHQPASPGLAPLLAPRVPREAALEGCRGRGTHCRLQSGLRSHSTRHRVR